MGGRRARGRLAVQELASVRPKAPSAWVAERVVDWARRRRPEASERDAVLHEAAAAGRRAVHGQVPRGQLGGGVQDARGRSPGLSRSQGARRAQAGQASEVRATGSGTGYAARHHCPPERSSMATGAHVQLSHERPVATAAAINLKHSVRR
eukprot:scaffold973_cov399-Prasinococcus_capsulatus_cf.AAC.7